MITQRMTGLGLARHVKDRNMDTLEPIIIKYVPMGAMLNVDGLASYNNLGKFGLEV